MARLSRLVALPLLALALSAAASTPAFAATFANGTDKQEVTVSNPPAGDVFAAGQSVAVTSPVSGELFAAGNDVAIKAVPLRSIIAAGNTVSSVGSGYDAFLAGNTVVLSGTYAHDVYVAANAVEIREGTVIGGDLRVAASQVKSAGTVKGSMYASVSSLAFSGGAIDGNLSYSSSQDAANLDNVKVAGTVHRNEPSKAALPSAGLVLWTWLIGWLSTAVLGAVLISLLPRGVIDSTAQLVLTGWGRNCLRGLAILIVTPLALLVVTLTVIGIKAAFLIGLLYMAALIVAGGLAAIILGRLLLHQFSKAEPSRWLELAVGTFALSLLAAIPFVGGVFALVFFIGLFLPVLGTSMFWIRQGQQ